MIKNKLHEQGGLVTFEILSNGTNITDTVELVNMEILLSKNNEIKLTIVDYDKFAIANSSAFKIGNSIEIKLGYDCKNNPICSALITRVEIKTNKEIGKILIVYCKSLNMHKGSDSSLLQLSLDNNVIDVTLSINGSKTNAANGIIITQGTGYVNPNDTITIDGFGHNFDGDVTVKNVLHKIDNGNWLSSIHI